MGTVPLLSHLIKVVQAETQRLPMLRTDRSRADMVCDLKHVHVGLGPASLRATVSERDRKPCRLDSLYD
jgi:hypothetical protein